MKRLLCAMLFFYQIPFQNKKISAQHGPQSNLSPGRVRFLSTSENSDNHASGVTQPSALGPVLLISDIDDTIKQSAIRHRLGRLRALRSKPFAGFNKLYTEFLCNPLVKTKDQEACLSHRAFIHPDNRWIAYITGAPMQASLLGQRFLQKNSFPPGGFWHRKSIMTPIKTFKFEVIHRLLTDLPKAKIKTDGKSS